MKCPHCGRENADSARFCSGCGGEIRRNQDKATGQTRRVQPYTIIIIILAVILAALVATAVFVMRKGNETSTGYERDSSLVVTGETSLTLLDLSELELRATDSDEALDVLDGLTGVLDIDSAEDELSLKNENTVDDTIYYRFQQEYQGLEVYGRAVVLSTDTDGNVALLSGNLVAMSGMETEAEIDEATAVSYALAYLEAESDVEAEAELCYYVTEEDNVPLLAYAVEIGFDTVFVDAVYGAVLDSISTVDSLTGYNADGTVEIPVEELDGLYYLYDSDRNIQVYTWNYQSSDDESIPVTSENLYFGDTEEEQQLEYDKGIKLLQSIQPIYDYYYSKYNDNGYGALDLYYNDGYDSGRNARGGNHTVDGVKKGFVSIGSELDLELNDVLSHEYTHMITRNIVNWAKGAETSAINEGISDIMGEMVEAWYYGECDWENPYRNLITPADNKAEEGYHISVYDEYEESIDGHLASTLISHAAYLMWTGTETVSITAIDDVELMSKLWYRTILLLNSDASFMDLRTCCEAAAGQMQQLGLLTQKQKNCVVWAFDQAGIYSSASIAMDSNLEINIYDYAENPTDQYVMTVTDAGGRTVGILNGETEGSTVTLTLDAGVYRITVSSQSAAYPSVSAVVTVKDRFDSTIMDFFNTGVNIYTTFGTNLQGQVTDENGLPLEGVQVTIAPAEINLESVEQFAEETSLTQGYLIGLLRASTDITSLTTDSNGSYASDLPIGVYQITYELEGYESVGVNQVVNAGDNTADLVVLSQTPMLDGDMLLGTWEIDNDTTMAENGVSMKYLFGTGYKYGSEMVFEEDGSFSYYAGIGYGGSGQYAINGLQIDYTVAFYEDSTRFSGAISIDNTDPDNLLLIMEYDDLVRTTGETGYKLYWKKVEETDEETDYSDLIAAYQSSVGMLDGNTFTVVMDADIYVSATDGTQSESMWEYIDFTANVRNNNLDSMTMSGNCMVEADSTYVIYSFYYEDGTTYYAYTKPRSQKGIATDQPLSTMLDYKFDLSNDNVIRGEEHDGMITLTVDGSVLNLSALLSEVMGSSYDCNCDELHIQLEMDSTGRPAVLTMTYTVEFSISGVSATADYVQVLTFSNYGVATVTKPSDLETYTGSTGSSVEIDDNSDGEVDSEVDSEGALVFNEHTYMLLQLDDVSTWEEAQAYCESVGGHLVTITSEEEQNAVYNYIKQFGLNTDIWIGITDKDNEGDWSYWITGEEVIYTNWGEGEPDNRDGRQNYGVICSEYRSGSDYYIEPGQWDDIANNSTYSSGYFICEWD